MHAWGTCMLGTDWHKTQCARGFRCMHCRICHNGREGSTLSVAEFAEMVGTWTSSRASLEAVSAVVASSISTSAACTGGNSVGEEHGKGGCLPGVISAGQPEWSTSSNEHQGIEVAAQLSLDEGTLDRSTGKDTRVCSHSYTVGSALLLEVLAIWAETLGCQVDTRTAGVWSFLCVKHKDCSARMYPLHPVCRACACPGQPQSQSPQHGMH